MTFPSDRPTAPEPAPQVWGPPGVAPQRTPAQVAAATAAMAAHRARLAAQPVLRFSADQLGTAARHIVAGSVTADELPRLIERCSRCQRQHGPCWHQAARLLIEHGLQRGPGPAPAST